MAEEKIDATTWQRLLPWTTLFRAFQVTLDVNKLLLAVAGILVTWLSWWLLGMIFTSTESSSPPDWSAGTYQAKYDNANDAQAWKDFRKDREHWNLLHEAAGLYRGSSPQLWELADIAETEREYKDFEKVLKDRPPGPETIKAYLAEIDRREATGSLTFAEARRYRARASRYALIGQPKPAGRLVVNPWAEDRGPNPYLLVTGQAGIPWEASNFGDWFSRDQLPVMIEPLVKLVRPVIYFLSPRNTALTRLYFFLVVVATVLTWSFFGGAITRIAAVQIARGERIGLSEAVRFTLKRIVSYVTAPMFPIVVVAGLMIILMIFGLFGAIPWLGDVLIDGFLWFIPLLFGLIMAMALVGLVGWPLMAATISTEGTDSWEAVTRAYGYVYQRPWQYAWYGLVSLVYGGLVIFFVGFMGSLTVYLAKWGVSQTPFVQTPNHLFVYAPTSFGWRELLLEGAVVPNTDPEQKEFLGREVVAGRVGSPLTTGTVGGVSRWTRIDPEAYRAYVGSLTAFNKLGAALVAFWLGLAFLLVLSVGYVFFWTASTIIYLLLRKSLESAELDEVYMEEEDYEATFRAPTPAAPAPTPAPAPAAPKAASLPMVEPPASPTPAPLTLPTPPPEPPKLPPAKDEDKGGKPPVV